MRIGAGGRADIELVSADGAKQLYQAVTEHSRNSESLDVIVKKALALKKARGRGGARLAAHAARVPSPCVPPSQTTPNFEVWFGVDAVSLQLIASDQQVLVELLVQGLAGRAVGFDDLSGGLTISIAAIDVLDKRACAYYLHVLSADNKVCVVCAPPDGDCACVVCALVRVACHVFAVACFREYET